MSRDLWLACCAPPARDDLARAIRTLEPGAEMHFLDDPQAMRLALREEEPGTVGAAVGMTAQGVSDINLAAALVCDGLARKVVLVGRGLSGSERSRAQTAGVAATIDVDTIPARRGDALSGVPGGTGQRHGDGRRHPASPMRAGKGDVGLKEKTGAPVLVVSSGRGGVGKTAISGTVAYSAGEQPKDSKGDNYDIALSAGNVNSNAISFEKKPYIYTTKSGTLDRMPIEQYNSSPIDFEQKHGDGVTWPKSTIALPAKATGIFVWNDVSKDWQENSREFTEEVVTIDNMTYYKYVDSRPYTAGDRRLKFTY